MNNAHHLIRRDEAALSRAIESNPDLAALEEQLAHLFANEAVFVSSADFRAMSNLVKVVEAVARLPGYRALVTRSDRHPPINSGAFMGYDFHLTAAGPRLIEINTNAGGAFLNAFAANALTVCCDDMLDLVKAASLPDFEDFVPDMMVREWLAAGRAGRPKTIAIVDEAPQAQFLYPELLLAQSHFAGTGITAFVVDPSDLNYGVDGVFFGNQKIDLVYNRLTDFQLVEPIHQPLFQAWTREQIVLTPSPLHHDLFANKRNLMLLSDVARLQTIGASDEQISALKLIPETVIVGQGNEDGLWANRKSYFFKPVDGYGSKAVWRGDKLTRKNWSYICQGGYVAQRFAPPGSKQIFLGEQEVERKVDLRLYAYAGEVFLVAARLYQGQTTNFRTPGGGFAPVFIV